MRLTVWLAAATLLAAVLAACGGDGNGGAVTASCDAITDIQSYRYSISLKLESPAFEPTAKATGEPLSAFADALTALFTDMRLDGAVVSPDRSQVVLRFQDEELELRSIEDKSWVRIGATWHEQDLEGEQSGLLTPEAVCQDTVSDLVSNLRGVGAQQETINGIETDHYRLDEADLKNLPGLLGTGGTTNLPQRFRVDLWLARDGRWPVRLQVAAADKDDSGEPTGLELFMEFRDINNPDIAIDPPVVAPAET